MKPPEILAELNSFGLFSPGDSLDFAASFTCAPASSAGRELARRILSGEGGGLAEPDLALSPKILAPGPADADAWRRDVTLGVISGGFDLLHPGHVRAMNEAAAFMANHPNGKLLVLTLADRDIRAKKGPGRPLLNINERLAMIAAVRCVDWILPLDRPDCLAALARLRPDFFFKSEDDRVQGIVLQEMNLVRANGGRVVLLPKPAKPTPHATELIQAIRSKVARAKVFGDCPKRSAWTVPESIDHHELGFPSRETFEFPNFVNAEVFRGECPCRCGHCPVGLTEPAARETRFGLHGMDLALYDKISAEVGAHPWATLRVHSTGEPLCWKDLSQALAIGRKNSARTWIFTSAVSRDRVLLETVCANVAVLEVSVNSRTREDYLKTKGVDAFALVVDNLLYLRGLKNRGLPVRIIASRTQSDNAAEDAAFVAHWKSSGLVDEAFVRSYHTYNGLLPACAGEAPAAAHQPCLVHWARFNISVDGQAVVCFNELFKPRLDPRLVFGDLRRQQIAQIWHGPDLAALRRAELTGDYSALDCREALPCPQCGSCQPLRGTGATSECQVQRGGNS